LRRSAQEGLSVLDKVLRAQARHLWFLRAGLLSTLLLIAVGVAITTVRPGARPVIGHPVSSSTGRVILLPYLVTTVPGHVRLGVCINQAPFILTGRPAVIAGLTGCAAFRAGDPQGLGIVRPGTR
jgi:hypothetical protein